VTCRPGKEPRSTESGRRGSGRGWWGGHGGKTEPEVGWCRHEVEERDSRTLPPIARLVTCRHITGESACPPAPVPPPPQPPGAAKEVADAAAKASKDYHHAFDAYQEWQARDARTMLVLMQTVEDSTILSLPTESGAQ
jgi:hypothetical protein